MKTKFWIGSICFILIFSLLNLGFNIYIFVTGNISTGDIFINSMESVVEIKAETESVGTSYGTAIAINNDGTFVTNAHVITYKQLGEYYEFEEISIRFIDEEDFRQVSVIKYDLDLDIAVLKINADVQVKAIKIGDDTKLQFGDNVYALGNMSNYGLSITAGSVSMPHVNVSYNENVRNVIQCDLTISDGNSGGALLNKNAELVGITTFRLKDQSNNIIYGIAYCIPINTIVEYINL